MTGIRFKLRRAAAAIVAEIPGLDCPLEEVAAAAPGASAAPDDWHPTTSVHRL